MTEVMTPDLCVIGGGAGGLSAATQAAALGLSVMLIERDRTGGARLHTACVPSKALLASAQRCHDIRHSKVVGISAAEPVVDFNAIAASIREVIEAVRPNDAESRLNALGIDVVQGEAKFEDKETVVVGARHIKARRFIVATGSRPALPPIPDLNRVPYFTEETVFAQTHGFIHLLILGGTPYAAELAQAYRRLGSEVTLFEPGLALARDDRELSDFVIKSLRDEGVRILEFARIERIETFGAALQIVFVMQNKSYSMEGSHLLVAMGRTPTLAYLNLEAANVKFGAKGILVDRSLKTSNPKVYAIGDVTGEAPSTTHVASYQASLAVRHALFKLPVRARYDTAPWVTFTDPEIAHVGVTEEAAREKFGVLSIYRWPYSENDLAHAKRQTGGFVKVIATRTGTILGAGVVGSQASEIIQMWSLAMQKGMSLADMSDIVCPYPTLSDMNRRVALSATAGRAQNPVFRQMVGWLAKMG